MEEIKKYAVVKIGGEQYRVGEGDEIEVFRLPEAENKKIVFDQVLLVKSDESVKVGRPLVTGAKVEAEVEKHFRGDKIRVATYKAKSRYRKVKGHRDELTRVRVEKIYVQD